MTAVLDSSPRIDLLTRATTLTRQVMERTREAIFAGEFPPGYELSEPQLAEWFGVSRGPVREALSLLESRGLIEKLPNGSRRVRSFARAEISYVYEVRTALEVAALAAVIRHGKPADVLREHVQRMRSAASENAAADLLDHDMKFHVALVRLAENPALVRAYDTVADQVRLIINRYTEESVDPSLIADDHASIIATIEAGDATKAPETMTAHIRGSIYSPPRRRNTAPPNHYLMGISL